MLFLGVAAAQPLELPGLAPLSPDGPDHTVVDLWRGAPGADKVHVLVTLPDGSEELFLFDTGASISALNRDVAERLGLATRPLPGLIEGLAGAVPWEAAEIPSLRIGELELRDVDVAVGVPGVPDAAGPLPVAGILGNNVWGNFTCVVDYPADVLELWRPGTLKGAPKGDPMPVTELHPVVNVRLRARDGTRAAVPLQIDTGAHDVLFLGATGEPFREASTVGVEPVLGIGASLDELPPQSLLQTTRRVALATARLGGKRVRVDLSARWLGADEQTMRSEIPGLVGYAALSKWRVILDFPEERVALVRSRRPPRVFDAAKAWLAREVARHGDAPDRAVIRARLHHGAGDEPAARAALDAAAAVRPDDAEIATFRAWYLRRDGKFDEALDVLLAVPPANLAEEHAWIGVVDALVLAGRVDEAVKRAGDALAALDEENAEELHVALADALLAAGRPGEAAAALDAGDGLSAHLLRRARVAYEDGDRYGAIVTLRDLVALYPLDGIPLWLYATLAEPADVPTFLTDLDAALARLHPGDEPWDFVGAALIAVGQEARGAEALRRGHARDCAPMPESPLRANCDAWYWALAGE
ncbi:MAG: aspartyl protease family protein, partial [Myxococcota bacterium]